MKRRRLATLAALAMAFGLVPAAVASADATDLVINEIMQNPSAVADSAGEWFEVHNTGTTDVDMDGWTVRDEDTDSFVISGTLVVPAGGFVVLGNNADSGTNGGVAVDYEFSGMFLGNSGDELVLLDTGLALIDRVEWDNGATFPDPNGASMTLGDPAVDNNDGTNWCEATSTYGAGDRGTPGAANDECTGPPTPDVTIQAIQGEGNVSPFEGEVVTTQGVVTALFFAGDRYAFIQDGTGPRSGLLLFNWNGFINVGDVVVVTGSVSEFFEMTEIAFGTVSVVGSAAVPAAEVLPTGEVGQEDWEAVLVQTVLPEVTATHSFGEFSIDDGSGPVRVDDLGNFTYDPTVGDQLAGVRGPVNFSFGNFKILPQDDFDIAPLVPIYDIQGAGQFGPLEGEILGTSGVVTAEAFNGDIWIQDATGDGDAATSDGIFVDGLGSQVDVGDEIVLIGDVEEQQFAPALPLTRLDDPVLVAVLSSGNPLPAPVAVTDLPNTSVPDAISFWEPLEGMRVSVADGTVVAPTSRFGEWALLTDADDKPGSGFFKESQQIVLRKAGPDGVDYNPERILVDDTTTGFLEIQVQPGDGVNSLTGVLDYTFGNYKIQPTDWDLEIAELPAAPVSGLKTKVGDLSVATFNVENLFDAIDNPDKDDQPGEGSSDPCAGCSPEEIEIQLTKLAASIEHEMLLPAIIVTQEGENEEILQLLGDRVNASAGTAYNACSFETSDGRGIEVGFLWDANRVDLADCFQITEAIVPGTEAAFGPSSPSPGREPLVGVFEIAGEMVTIVGVHFKSKGGDDPIFSVNQLVGLPFERITEVQRKAQAQVVRDFLDMYTDPDEDMVMVTGDFNDFQFGEPGEGPDHPVAIVEGNDLRNLVHEIKAAQRFTFVFDGNSQVLDHMLVSGKLWDELERVDIAHFNTSYPAALSGDPSTTLRSSDHDPIVARFDIG